MKPCARWRGACGPYAAVSRSRRPDHRGEAEPKDEGPEDLPGHRSAEGQRVPEGMEHLMTANPRGALSLCAQPLRWTVHITHLRAHLVKGESPVAAGGQAIGAG